MSRDASAMHPHRPACLDTAGGIGAWMHDIEDNRAIVDRGVARLFGLACYDRVNGDPRTTTSTPSARPTEPASRLEFEAASRGGQPIALQCRIRTSTHPPALWGCLLAWVTSKRGA